MQFGRHPWLLTDRGKYCLNTDGLNHVINRALISWREHDAEFKVYQWMGKEDYQFQVFLVVAWLSMKGLPLQHLNRMDLARLVTKFPHLIEVDEEIVEKIDM